MLTFLKTVLIILLVYFGLKILLRWAGPYLMRYFLKKMNKRFAKSFGMEHFDDRKPQKEGSVSIDKMPPRKSTRGTTVGEYVDYEEID